MRNVRNWWLELEVDGAVSKVATGPRGKEGGFTLRVSQRDQGGVLRDAVVLRGVPQSDGTLVLTVGIEDRADIKITTTR